MEKQDLSSAYRRLVKSTNRKTRKRALKLIHEHKRKRTKQAIQLTKEF